MEKGDFVRRCRKGMESKEGFILRFSKFDPEVAIVKWRKGRRLGLVLIEDLELC